MVSSHPVPDTITVAAHAKVNLFLRVLARETSGFHALETLFALLELADTLIVERTPAGVELEVIGAETGPCEENLAVRAARLVLDATGNRFGVRLRLEKHIPVAAGLGGGSSDGAAALHAVNALADGAVPRHELLQFAAKLGSDVPFLASGAPMALAWGRGERLFRLPPSAAAPVLVVVPPFGVSTAKAYALLDAAREETVTRGSVVLDPEAFGGWGSIGRLGGNDFEIPVFGKEPALRTLYEKLCQTGPLLARLSGSGAALFGIYKTERDRDAAALEIGERDATLIKTMTRASPPSAPASA